MNIQDVLGALISSLVFVTLILIGVYLYYSLGLPLMILGLFLLFLFFFQTFQITVGPKPSVSIKTRV